MPVIEAIMIIGLGVLIVVSPGLIPLLMLLAAQDAKPRAAQEKPTLRDANKPKPAQLQRFGAQDSQRMLITAAERLDRAAKKRQGLVAPSKNEREPDAQQIEEQRLLRQAAATKAWGTRTLKKEIIAKQQAERDAALIRQARREAAQLERQRIAELPENRYFLGDYSIPTDGRKSAISPDFDDDNYFPDIELLIVEEWEAKNPPRIRSRLRE